MSRRKAFNEFFVCGECGECGEDILREVLQRATSRFLGPEACTRPSYYNVCTLDLEEHKSRC